MEENSIVEDLLRGTGERGNDKRHHDPHTETEYREVQRLGSCAVRSARVVGPRSFPRTDFRDLKLYAYVHTFHIGCVRTRVRWNI